MSAGSAKGKKSKKSDVQDLIAEAQEQAKRHSSSSKNAQKIEKAGLGEFADISNNPFYKVIFDPEATPTEKMEAVAQNLTYTDDKEDSEARLDEFKKFKDYLQFERKRMAKQIIELTDTDAFAELKEVYDELNNALMSFEDKIAPLTDIVDAVYDLRMNGLTFDAFREIAADKEAEARIAALRAEQEEKLEDLESNIKNMVKEIAVLGEDKAFFGLGGVKKSAREKIAQRQIDLKDTKDELGELKQQIQDESLYKLPESELGEEHLESKRKLRELLDISSDEHRQRQHDLVSAAQHFVNTTEERVGNINEHFERMDGQIDNLMEANYSMREIYAILNDATKEAHGNNEDKRKDLQEDASEDLGEIEKMNVERQKRDIENYIGALSASAVDTTSVFAELTNSNHRIKSMRDGNDQQITKTRQIHSSGVAGVADQLSTVLQAVSAAALGESSEMAKMSLERMNSKTQDLSQKEVIRLALGSQEQNSELSKALEGLEQYGEVIRTATNITREGLQETKDLLGQLEDTAKSVQEDVKESIAVAADVISGQDDVSDNDDDAHSSDDVPDPFNISKSG